MFQSKGFTMLEVTVALGIIAVGLLGVVSLVIQNLQVERVNKNELIASMLAQEGIELVRNARDTNWLKDAQGDEWKNGGGADMLDLLNDLSYTIDINGTINDIPNAVDDNETRLYLDDSGMYFHPTLPTTATPTPYYRLITVVDEGERIAASSTVRWRDQDRTREYVAETYFYNWR